MITFALSTNFSLSQETNQIAFIRLFLKLFSHKNAASTS
jgi:hypothetical protein